MFCGEASHTGTIDPEPTKSFITQFPGLEEWPEDLTTFEDHLKGHFRITLSQLAS